MKNLSMENLHELEIALHYMFVGELKEICEHFHLSYSGKKAALIKQILCFIKSGKNLQPPSIPEISKAKKGVHYPLHSQTLILIGSYKNDLKTRLFMKGLVGEHFHFTVFGQDWMKDRWLSGKPPTYQEFADFWQKEHEARQGKTSSLKKEWAYLNFIRRYLKDMPHASRKEMTEAWKKERSLQVKKAKTLLNQVVNL